jgi:hypothetical protein
MIRAALLIFVLLIFSSTPIIAQDALDSLLIRVEKKEPLLDLIERVQQTNSIRFFYREEWLRPFVARPLNEPQTLRSILLNVFDESEMDFEFLYNYAVILYKNPARELLRDSIISSADARQVTVEQISIGSKEELDPGETSVLRGIIRDFSTNHPIPGATVFVHGINLNTQTDANGRFQLKLKSGEYAVEFRFINYKEKIVNLRVYSSGELSVELEETPTVLEEIVVSDQSITTRRAGQSALKMVDVSRAPAFMGEVDVIRMLQTQAGVTSVSEASTGFNVRGGSVDQNLVLFDGVPVFNTSHALGFFTAFNSEAIRDVSLYKAGIPAEFGGRVSSVLNMTSKEGSFKKWSGEVGLGIVSGNFIVGGPLKRDTSSLMVSFRSSYSDWILNVLRSEYQDINESSVFFYDGTLKSVTNLRKGARLTISSYLSQDRFKLTNDTINQWQNLTFSARYDRQLRSNLYFSAGLYGGRYMFEMSDEEPAAAFNLKYKVLFPSLKFDFNRDGVHKQTFGFHVTYYSFYPGDLKPSGTQTDKTLIKMPGENSVESALYISDAFYWGNKIHVEAGLRQSLFNRIGSGLVYRYQDNKPLEPRNVVDSLVYSSGQIMKTYAGLEPRLSVRYIQNNRSSIKLSYNRNFQYIHLVSNTASVTPVDIWQSSNTYFKPQIADQVSIGYFRNSSNTIWEIYVDTYYKYIQNILDFKDGANLILNRKLETALLQGINQSYGAEVSIEKTKGRLVGSANYTFSRSLRKIDRSFQSEKVNEGNYYPSNFDQPHSVNLNWRYSLTRKVFFSGAFTYHTGRPVSLPRVAYEVNESPIIDFSERNNYRLKDYHRLDLALVIEGTNKKKKILEGQWTISVYNLYGRKNPYSAFFRYNVAGAVMPFQISLIGVPIPSITYGLKF